MLADAILNAIGFLGLISVLGMIALLLMMLSFMGYSLFEDWRRNR